jgi:hypothetical protein
MRAMTTRSKHNDSNVTASLLLSACTNYQQSLEETTPLALFPRDPMPFVGKEFINFQQKAVLSSPHEQRDTFFQTGIKWAEGCSKAGLFRGYSRPSSAGEKLLSPAIESSESPLIAVPLNSCAGG